MDIIGMKFSPPGVDVTKAPDNQLSVISANDSLKGWREKYLVNNTTVTPLGGGGFAPATIPHGLGYAPMFAAYYFLPSLNRFFLSYDFTTSLFENPDFNIVSVDSSNVNVWLFTGHSGYFSILLFVDNISPIADPSTVNNAAVSSDSKYGVEISVPGVDITKAKDYQKVMSSKFQTPLIVQSGTITLTAPALTVACDDAQNGFDQVIIPHSLGYAAHFLVQSSDGSESFAYSPNGSSIARPFYNDYFEFSIDASNIRARVSRGANGNACATDPTGYTFPAKTYTLKYFLTSIKLPS